jgi:hypothetical protein
MTLAAAEDESDGRIDYFTDVRVRVYHDPKEWRHYFFASHLGVVNRPVRIGNARQRGSVARAHGTGTWCVVSHNPALLPMARRVRNYALSGRLDNKIGHLAPGRVLAGGEDLDYAGPYRKEYDSGST